MADDLSRFDLRMRSLDEPWGDNSICGQCDADAEWSVWLHTPEWSPGGGLTLVRCTPCALTVVATQAVEAVAPSEEARGG